MNTLIILGHPRKDSFCAALAQSYREGAEQAGVQIRQLVLADLQFDPQVHLPAPEDQALEDDLRQAQALLEWADHLVFVYPGWWGTMPALLKGFLDRVLLPGFAFAYQADGGWKPLLKGKTAQLIVTMDMPSWVYRWIYKQPGHHAMQRSILGFCGVRTTRILAFGPVKESTPLQRAEWLEQARSTGFKLRHGALSRSQRLVDKGLAWLKAFRLQFYPMTWIAYTVGALGAAAQTGSLAQDSYWLGYLVLFWLEVAAVLSNDYFDFESDRINDQHGPFTGGSRVLVEKQLGFGELRAGIGVTLVLTLLAATILFCTTTAPAPGGIIVLAVMSVLALGYTVPPLKLSHRGLGEFDVGLTHSLGVILCGYVFQGGVWHNPFPWIASIPLFLAILPAIILSGIPDYQADKQVGKQTLVVKLGPGRATLMAMGFTLLAALTALLWQQLGLAYSAFAGAVYFVLPHAAVLFGMLFQYWRQRLSPARIDGLMVASLTYILWFGALSFYRLA